MKPGCFIPCLIVLAIVCGTVKVAVGEKPAFAPATYVYKRVGDTEIRADVYRADDSQVRPVLLWIHGGAYMMGSRTTVYPSIRKFCASEGIILVSIDYRLAPETKLPRIIEDIVDAGTWVREQGPQLFAADPNRLIVAGNSAGGYLSLVAGVKFRPRPRAIVSYWGPSRVDRKMSPLAKEYYLDKTPAVPKKEALAAIQPQPITHSEKQAFHKQRQQLLRYYKQNGLFLTEITGYSVPQNQSELDRLAPVLNVDSNYPPTFFLHGTADPQVDYQSAVDMAAALKKQGVYAKLFSVPKGGHGLTGGEQQTIQQGHQQARDFMRTYFNKN